MLRISGRSRTADVAVVRQRDERPSAGRRAMLVITGASRALAISPRRYGCPSPTTIRPRCPRSIGTEPRMIAERRQMNPGTHDRSKSRVQDDGGQGTALDERRGRSARSQCDHSR